MADVFISYSRQRDTEFADRLAAALAERGQETWVDREGIYPSSPWAPEIEQAILEAHAVIFVISPESVASQYCRAELDHAIALGKRVVPVLAHETPAQSVPPELAELHFLSFIGLDGAPPDGLGTPGSEDGSPGEGDGFARQVDRLVEVLVTDVGTVHLHTRLLTQATRWSQTDEDRSMLLRGRELSAAERWLGDQTSARRTVLPLQLGLISASRRAANRRQRGSVGLSLMVATAMAVLAVVAVVQRSQAVHQSNIALAGDLAAESGSASGTDVEAQGLLALASYERSATVLGRSALVAAAEQPLEASMHASLGEVNAVAYDPHGGLLAAGYKSGIAIWDTATGKMVGQPFDTSDQVNGLAFSPDGTVLAAAEGVGDRGDIGLFTVATHRARGSLQGDGSAMTAVAYAPDGTQVAGATYAGNVYLWDTATGQSGHASVTTSGSVLSVAFSPDGSQLAAAGGTDLPDGGENGVVDLYSGSLSSPLSFTDQGSAVDHVAFDPKGSVLAATDDGGGVVLLSSSNLGSEGRARLRSDADALAFDPAGNLLATGDSQGGVQEWSTSSLQEVGTTMETGSIVYGLAYSPDGASLASGDFGGDVLIWSSSERMPGARSLQGRSVLQVSVNSSSTLFATDDRDGSVGIWDLAKRKLVRYLSGGSALTSVDFSPTGPTSLAIGESDGDVALYDTATKRSITLDDRAVRGSGVAFSTFSPDGSELAVGYYDGKVAVWKLGSGRRVFQSYKAPSSNAGGVTAVLFSPDGSELVVAYEGYGLEVFHPASPANEGTPVDVNEVAFSLAFTPDGKVLAAGDNDGDVELFDASNLRAEGSLPGDGSVIYALSFSTDGRTLASVDGGGDLHLWDLASRQELGPPLTTSSAILALGFAPNGNTLVTGDGSGTIVLWPSLLWSTDFQRFSVDLCPRIGENISQAQWDELVPGRSHQTSCPGYPQSP